MALDSRNGLGSRRDRSRRLRRSRRRGPEAVGAERAPPAGLGIGEERHQQLSRLGEPLDLWVVSAVVERDLSGAEPATTNNRMELTAAMMALEALKRPCRVVLHTDSEYVRNGITRWHTGWVRRNWRNAAGDPVANMPLWQRLLAAAKDHEVEWRWVRGHSGDVMNERADALATAAREAIAEV